MQRSHKIKVLVGWALFVLMLGLSAGARAGEWCFLRRPAQQSNPETAARPKTFLHGPAHPSADAGPGTHFGVQEFPWGYFGAVPCCATAFHQSYYGEPIRYSLQRAD